MGEKNSWFREACGIATAMVATPLALGAATCAGLAKAVEDKSWRNFEEAFDETGMAFMDGAHEFGKEFGPQVVIGLVTVVGTGALAGKSVTDEHGES